MTKSRWIAATALLLAALLFPGFAVAQSGCPTIVYGAVLTAGQWNACFAAKQDALGYTPLSLAGGTMTGKLTTAAPTAGTAGFALPHGTAPSSPVNGDVWTTTGGAFVQINGTTVQFAGTAASTVLSVANSDGTLTISPTTGAVVASINLAHANTWTAQQTFTINQNSGTSWQVSNSSAGTGALAFYNAANGTGDASLGIGGTGYTAIPLLQNRAFVNGDAGTAGIVLNNQGANPIIFAISNAEVGRWDTSAPGQLFLGVANTTVGRLALFNATSGSIVISPPSGALGSSVATLPVNTGTIAELNLAQSWPAVQTFTASGAGIASGVIVSAASPSIAWQATGQGADAKLWDAEVTGLVLNFRTVNDASTVAVNWLSVTRSGNTIASVTFPTALTATTSLAIGGGSIGSDALEVTGTTTLNGSVTVTGGSVIMSGSIASAAWTTNGIRLRGVPATLTDTSSSGTVAAAYTDVLGGNTIAASSAVTYTNYDSLYVKAPVAGANVTFTNSWALGADSLRIGTSNQLTITTGGALTVPGTATLQGAVTFGIPNVAGAQISLANTTNSNLVGLAVPNGASAYTFSLPTNGGTTGQFLASAGGATLTWDNISAHLTQGTGITLSGTTNVTIAIANQIAAGGPTGSSTAIPIITYNAQGQLTVVSTAAVVAPAGTLTGTTLASNVVTTSITSTGTMTSGTLSTGYVIGGVTMTLGSDANYDVYYRNSSGVLTRLAAGTAGQVLSTNGTGSAPSWIPAGGTGTVTSVVCAATTITTTGTCYSAGQVVGTATNDNATAGNFGEYQPNNTATNSLTSGSSLTVASVSLTAGDWDVSCSSKFNPAATTSITTLYTSVSPTNNVLNTAVGAFVSEITPATVPGTGNPPAQATPILRASLSGTTIYYCVVNSTFTISTLTADGAIRARRVR